MDSYESLMESGVTVTGRYNRLGGMNEAPKVIGTEEELAELQEKISRTLLVSGDIIVPTLNSTLTENKKKVKVKKQKVTPKNYPKVINTTKVFDPESNSYYEELSGKSEDYKKLDDTNFTTQSSASFVQKKVIFQNDFGMIRLNVEEIVYQDQFSIMLVFSNDDELTFIPKVGEKLDFSSSDGSFDKVFFPGSLFDYHGKKIMILFIDNSNSTDNIKYD
jgi:hypothetical protein